MAWTRRRFLQGSGQLGAAWGLTRGGQSRGAQASRSALEQIRNAEPLDGIEIIDAHAHFRGLGHDWQRGVKLLVGAMDRCGINMAVFSHSNAIGASTGEALKAAHDASARAVRANPNRLRAYLVFHPHLVDESVRQMERALEPKSPFVGFKLHGVSHDYPVDGPNYRHVYEFANRHRLPVLSHLVSSHGAVVPILRNENITAAMDHILREFPEMRLIWAHFGRGVDDWVAYTAKHRNVTMETASSGVPYRVLERTVASAGADRILFGTDATYLSAGGQLAKVAFAAISDEDKKKIFSGNARRVFGKSLDPSPG